MKGRLLAAAVVLALTVIAVPSASSAALPPLPDVPHQYALNLVLNETGAQVAADPAWWSTTWGGGTITASGGNLRIHSAGSAAGSGGVRSTTRFWRTGVFEFRVWLPGSNGKLADWPALWFSGRPWPSQGEIDVLEGLNGTDQVTYHYGATAPGSSKSTSNRTLPAYSARPGPGWHTIDLVWAPAWARVYTDGRLLTILQGTWFMPGPEMIRLQVNSGGCCGLRPGTSASMYVQYVRVWRFR